MARTKPKPQTFTEEEYKAITDAFSFVFYACERNGASIFDRAAASKLRAPYQSILEKIGPATYGDHND